MLELNIYIQKWYAHKELFLMVLTNLLLKS